MSRKNDGMMRALRCSVRSVDGRKDEGEGARGGRSSCGSERCE